MKTQHLLVLLLVVAVAGGGYWWYSQRQENAGAAAKVTPPAPSRTTPRFGGLLPPEPPADERETAAEPKRNWPFSRTSPASGSSGEDGEEEPLPTYSDLLTGVAGSLYGPLSGEVDVSADLAQVRSLAGQNAQGRGDAGDAARLAIQCAAQLQELQAERIRRVANYTRMAEREFDSLNNDTEKAAKTKAFFIKQVERQWQEHIAYVRPRMDRALARIRALE